MGRGRPKGGGKTPGSGRKPGTPNRTTAHLREVIEQVVVKLGGVERLYEWVQQNPDNERVFWSSIATKLLPVQVAGDATNPVTTNVVVSWKQPTRPGTEQ